MTAYAIHAYDFKLKKYIYAFILAVMMIPTQVTALGFVKISRYIKNGRYIYPFDRPNDRCTGHILLHETVHGKYIAGISDRGSQN